MVQGQRSPRWAVWTKMTVPCEDGTDYLVRRRIVQTPWFGVYVHDINERDKDRDPHNHPWSFVSIVLRGHYTENYYPNPKSRSEFSSIAPYYYRQTWKRFSVHKMGRNSAHKITEAGPKLKTLIITGPRKGSWGFFTRIGFVDWKDYNG